MNRNFIDEIKYQWKYGGMHIKLIGVNVAVFLFINLLLIFGGLSVPQGVPNPVMPFIDNFFTLKGTFHGFITHPWGLFTSIFAHISFWHIAFNMVFLYFISKFFLSYFSNERMLYTYILGGIAGGIFQIGAYAVFPALQGQALSVLGASGAVMAIFMAAAFYRPHAIVHLFGLIRVKMIWIALAFIFLNFLEMNSGDNVAHFAHLGGLAFGFFSIRNIHSKNNIVSIFQRWVERLKNRFSGKPKMKAHKGGRRKQKENNESKQQTDEEYNLQKKKKQEKINQILDKISKSGYDSLTKKEKNILFEQSNR